MSKKRRVEIVFSQTFLQSVISLFCGLSCSKPKCNNNAKKGKGPHFFFGSISFMSHHSSQVNIYSI